MQSSEDDRDGAIPEPVRAAWRDACAHWAEPGRHQLVLALVAQHGCFVWAAARYRERAGDPVADSQLERLRRAATASLLATATVRQSPDENPYRRTVGVFAVLLVMLVLGLAAAALIRHNHTASAPTPAQP